MVLNTAAVIGLTMVSIPTETKLTVQLRANHLENQ